MSKKVEALEVNLDTGTPPVAAHPIEAEHGTIIDYFPTVFDKTAHTKLGVGYDRRPNSDAILGVVLHIAKEGNFAEEAQRIARAHKESVHYLVGVPADQVVPVACIVPPFLMAYHAGPSMGFGFSNWDHISIGIAVQVPEGAERLDPRQWHALTWLVGMLSRHYTSISFVVKHSRIAQFEGDEKPVNDEALGSNEELEKWKASLTA